MVSVTLSSISLAKHFQANTNDWYFSQVNVIKKAAAETMTPGESFWYWT